VSRAARPAPRGRGSQRTRRPCVLAARAQVPPRRRTPAPRPALPIRSSGRELCARGRELLAESAAQSSARGAPGKQSSRPRGTARAEFAACGAPGVSRRAVRGAAAGRGETAGRRRPCPDRLWPSVAHCHENTNNKIVTAAAPKIGTG